MSDNQNIDLHAIARKAMVQYGFQFKFPKPVLDEVKVLDETQLLHSHQNSFSDLRSLLWSSIDNADSLDLDQLEYCEWGDEQTISVKIAIAEVDLFVPRSSLTDEYAAHNGSSVYTGVETFPMLPQRLSNDLSSLLADRERPAVIIEFTVLPDGNITNGNIYRALICNKAKLVYEEIGSWLEGKGPLPASVSQVPGLEEQLRLQDAASQRLRALRMERGALELDTIEVNPVIREDQITDLIVPAKNRARYIIENFMIAANQTMVHFLGKSGFPMIQRVVRTPKDWAGIVKLASDCGDILPSDPDPKALSEFLLRRKTADRERFPDLSLAVIKLLGAAEYVVIAPGEESWGHFGLAVTDYTHSTAPNRRYVDVIIQRLLKASLNRQPSPYTREDLNRNAAWCTEREKAAKKVKRFMLKAEAASLLQDRRGEIFTAIVTGASEKGVYARLLSPPVEGRVIRGGSGLEVGQKVKLRLAALDPYQGHIDLEKVNFNSKEC